MALIWGPKGAHAGCTSGLCKHLEFVPGFSWCVPQCVRLWPRAQPWELSASISGGHQLLVLSSW